MSLHDAVGALGVALIVGTYLLLQIGGIRPTSSKYSFLNALGALLVLISLAFDFNLSAALVEGFWLAISVYGLVKSIRAK